MVLLVTESRLMHYYQFNIGDYASHTRHLTLVEDLIYRRLLDWYYLNEKQIPLDCIQTARLIQAKDHFSDVELVLNEFFSHTELGWINKRADIEIIAFKAKKEQTSNAGKASAAARFNDRSTDVQLNKKQEPLNNNHKTLNRKQETKEPSAAFALPDWVKQSDWDLWMQTRKGKKMIPAQMQAQVNKLERWKDAGIDYASALAASAEAGWSGLFEPKMQRGGASSSQSENDQIREAARKRIFGEQTIESI